MSPSIPSKDCFSLFSLKTHLKYSGKQYYPVSYSCAVTEYLKFVLLSSSLSIYLWFYFATAISLRITNDLTHCQMQWLIISLYPFQFLSPFDIFGHAHLIKILSKKNSKNCTNVDMCIYYIIFKSV